MHQCRSCGHENRAGARFCDACGAELDAGLEAGEQRKTVTVLFCDVTGSTALGERLDPESLRAVMARYFERAGPWSSATAASVEKFIGDAVMAVFGIPVLHEDDALRAVRAAVELRDGLAELNDGLDRDFGTTLELRIGVNTGEVVTGTEERLATGDAVNVAARLEQAARPGEILLGAETAGARPRCRRRRGDRAARAEGKGGAASSPTVSSRSAPSDAARDAPADDGRTRARAEPAARRDGQAVADRSCQLFTVLGAAGVGKSRLVHEFLDGLDERHRRARDAASRTERASRTGRSSRC